MKKGQLLHLFIPAVEESWSKDAFKDQSTCFIRVVLMKSDNTSNHLENKYSSVNIKIPLHYEPCLR